jgi:molybdopterin-synthase adenylyltransferase
MSITETTNQSLGLAVESRPRLKPFLHVFRRDHDFLFYDWGRKRAFGLVKMTEPALSIVRRMDGRLTVEEIAEEHGVSAEAVIQLIAKLRQHDLVTDHVPEDERRSAICLSLETFATRARSPSAMADRLSSATVAIVGVGGIGSWVAQHLAMQNIGGLVLVDPDVVAERNLHRQTLFGTEDVGTAKVKAAARTLRRIAPDVNVTCVRELVDPASDPSLLDPATLVIAAADYPTQTKASGIVSRKCFDRKQPHIAGFGYTSVVVALPQTIVPTDSDSACLYCHKEDLPPEVGEFEFQSPQGRPLSPVASMLGSIVALEAIRLITDYEPSVFRNVRADFDFGTLEIMRRAISRDDNCAFCSTLR